MEENPFFCFSLSQIAAHDWIRADCNSTKCQVCHRKIKTLAGRRCVWCQEMVRIVCVRRYWITVVDYFCAHQVLCLLKRHDECLFSGLSSCDCGPLRDHILPPWAIYAVSKVKWTTDYNHHIFFVLFCLVLFDICRLSGLLSGCLFSFPAGRGHQPVKCYSWWPHPAGKNFPLYLN